MGADEYVRRGEFLNKGLNTDEQFYGIEQRFLELEQRMTTMETSLDSLDRKTARMKQIVLGDDELEIESIPTQLKKLSNHIQNVSYALVAMVIVLCVLGLLLVAQ